MADSDRTLDAATLARIFAAAGLSLTSERLDILAPHADAILGGASHLREADVSAVEPPLAFLPWMPDRPGDVNSGGSGR